MPPPQCPECGRFLATAFVEQIKQAPAPCPRCGTELSLEDEASPTPSQATTDAAAVEPPRGVPDVEPEPTTSVRPPDRDPLEGWDETATVPTGVDRTGTRAVADPAVLAAGAGIGVLVGLLLGGRQHRGLGALVGAALGAVVARLRAG